MRITAKVWEQVFVRDKGFCQYCNADLLASRATYSAAQVDHIHAVAAGGAMEELENLKLACAICNNSLSRYNHLTTFDARKAIMDEKNKVHEENFQKMVKRLRLDWRHARDTAKGGGRRIGFGPLVTWPESRPLG